MVLRPRSIRTIVTTTAVVVHHTAAVVHNDPIPDRTRMATLTVLQPPKMPASPDARDPTNTPQFSPLSYSLDAADADVFRSKRTISNYITTIQYTHTHTHTSISQIILATLVVGGITYVSHMYHASSLKYLSLSINRTWPWQECARIVIILSRSDDESVSLE